MFSEKMHFFINQLYLNWVRLLVLRYLKVSGTGKVGYYKLTTLPTVTLHLIKSFDIWGEIGMVSKRIQWDQESNRIVFSDASMFCLCANDGRRRACRRPGETQKI